MNKLKRKSRIFIFSLALGMAGIFVPADLPAQCPMCKMGAETNLKNGGTAGKGLNAGILYMLAMPYILIGTFGYIWWKNNKGPKPEIK